MSDQTVIVRKMLPASCEEVYDAWLDPEGMSQWMCPGPVTVAEGTLEARVGGHLRVVMSAPERTVREHRSVSRPGAAVDVEVHVELQPHG